MADFSLVLTYYNEALILEQSVKKIVTFLDQVRFDGELIFIDDDSSDDSWKILQELRGSLLKGRDVQCRRNEVRQGRGASVDQGFTLARTDLVGYIDTDLDIPVHYILPACMEMKRGGWDALIGHRAFDRLGGHMLRILMTETYALMVRWYLGFPYRQTEAGFKFFRKERYEQIRGAVQSRHWSWDTEVMYHCHRQGFRVYEMPITVEHQTIRPSNVKVARDTLSSLRNLYRMKKRVRA